MRIRQHHPATIVFLLVKQEDMLTPAPGEPPPVLLSRNSAFFAASTNQAEPIDDGWYRLLLTAEETDTAGPLIVRAGRDDTHEWRDILEVVPPLEIDQEAIVTEAVARLRAQPWQIAMPVVPLVAPESGA
jgi:hypothetical protein